ncbi:spore gernimation protein GerD [Oceanobacillus piezotolerans]|uniref:Spore gernimation protein GerD n=1 Tax=Oceanobacillus piezotolerans TaxID=2448030 RepID=A0A498D1U3_9BACI|nr:spore germination lipoprotein GerD [Oceanobacillus piezotolerans]RLL39952.1 spore gernimation protein GerD [Oceanobacillus piezotolerans]
MMRYMFLSLIGFFLLFLAACGGAGGNASGNQGDYEQTKKMVVDILQTEEGKKALTEILSDQKMKEELIMNSDQVKTAINETLVSDKGKKMWTTLFEDPKFVEGFAKSMEEPQKELQKSLMSDADYQKQMLELLQNPEITDQMLSVLKSQQFRAHLEETIQQTLETPTFQAKMQEILLKAAEEQAKSQGEGGGGSNSGQGGQGGGQSGGGKGQGGGGGAQ